VSKARPASIAVPPRSRLAIRQQRQPRIDASFCEKRINVRFDQFCEGRAVVPDVAEGDRRGGTDWAGCADAVRVLA